MTREEEFYAAILAAINGDDHTCPTPVWRYEEYLAAIANAIQNGGGGGSSGGGVLVVHGTWNDEQTILTLDKTWKEIFDAGFAVLVYLEDDFKAFSLLVEMASAKSCYANFVNFGITGSTVEVTMMHFTAATENDYPHFYAEP